MFHIEGSVQTMVFPVSKPFAAPYPYIHSSNVVSAVMTEHLETIHVPEIELK